MRIPLGTRFTAEYLEAATARQQHVAEAAARATAQAEHQLTTLSAAAVAALRQRVIDSLDEWRGRMTAAVFEDRVRHAMVAALAEEMVRGKATPPSTTASVPFMVTRQMQADLSAAGFTLEQINQMTPAQAWAHLNGSDRAPA